MCKRVSDALNPEKEFLLRIIKKAAVSNGFFSKSVFFNKTSW